METNTDADTRSSAENGHVRRARFRAAPGCCLDCVGDISRSLRQIPGVERVDVSSSAGVVVVEHDGRVTPEEVQHQAAGAGVTLVPADARAPESHTPWWRQPKLIALAVATVLFLIGLGLEVLAEAERLPTVLYLATVVVGGFYPAASGLKALRTGRLTISSLLVAATAGAIALGVFEEAAMLVVVFSLGEVLEEYVTDRARGSIRALMSLAPPVAARRTATGETDAVPVEHLMPGDHILVRPAERIPTDGEVASGSSYVDQSAVTGESIPVEVTAGSTVFGGTLNGTGALEVRVTKEYADTTLPRVIRQVEEAQSSKGRAQRFAERFGAVYTPAMFVLAILVAVLPPLWLGGNREWLYRALVVLTVSCSCGLVISVPAAVVAAITRAARDGILIKGGIYLEALARIRAVAFDKTGTLTGGVPRLTDVVPLGGRSEQEVLSLAAAVEASSEHPLAAAILTAAQERGVTWPQATSAQARTGFGIEASVDGRRLFVGRPDAADRAVVERAGELETQGKTVVALFEDGRPLALFAVADTIRSEAKSVVRELHELGVRHLVMLTGDNERTAAAVARELGLDHYRARLLPHEKTTAVKELATEYGPVAMVGDGVNDAPALATAEVGVAMGAAGTDVAIETADVALMADDLAKLPQAVNLSHRALANVKQNIVLSLLTVAILVSAALFGWMSLTTGLLLNEGTALLIIANALRLLRHPTRPSTGRRDPSARGPANASTGVVLAAR